MSIKINGQEVKKRIRNGVEVQKVIVNWLKIWPYEPQPEREPTIYTKSYWPMNAANGTDDLSWNVPPNNLTAHNITFYHDSAYFPDSNTGANYLQDSNIYFGQGEQFYMWAWAMASESSAEMNPRILWAGQGDRWFFIAIDRAGKRIQYWEPMVTWQSVTLNIQESVIWDFKWIYYYYTWTVWWPVRGGLIDVHWNNIYGTGTGKQMPQGITIWTNGSPSWRTYDSWRWNIGEVIIENREWSNTDILNYWYDFKWNFWL